MQGNSPGLHSGKMVDFPRWQCQGSPAGLAEERESDVCSPRQERPGNTVAVVGVIGTAINTLGLYLLSRWAGLPLAAASALAVELAAVSTYLLDDSWTLAARTPTFRRFAKFNVAVLMGLALNVFTVWFLARLGLYFLAANLLGIAIGFTVNHAFGVPWVWGRAV
jgi:putative flippase GtrA